MNSVRLWHFSAVPTAPSNVGFREKTRRHMLNASSSQFYDPLRTSAAPALIAAGPPFHDAELSRYDAAFWAREACVKRREFIAWSAEQRRRPPTLLAR